MLSASSGTTPVTVTLNQAVSWRLDFAGGTERTVADLRGGVPVRITAAGGAGEVSVDGASYSGVGGGSVFATEGWSATAAGFDVDATAGTARLSVARWSR